MPTDRVQPDQAPYRLMEQLTVDLDELAVREEAFLKLQGGPFPERENDFRDLAHVLDLACGVGSWAIEVARANPHLEVVGVAPQKALLARAQERAEHAHVKNAHFALMMGTDRPQLPFSTAEFDLVNTQYLHAWLREDEWLDFVRECWRIIRPGGYLRMTEPERGQATSLAFTRLEDLYLQTIQRIGHKTSPDERHIGAANQLTYLLQEVGAAEITRRSVIIDYGKEGDSVEQAPLRLQLYAQGFRTLILQQGLITPEELDALVQQVHTELQQKNFAANRFLITVCARKPTKDEESLWHANARSTLYSSVFERA